jgi:cytochrome P450
MQSVTGDREPSRSRGGLPPRAPLPSALQTYAFWRDPHAYLRWCQQRSGQTFTMRPLGKPPLVFMSHIADIRAIVSAPSDVLHPGEGGGVIAPLVGPDSFMLADGDRHRAGRRAILPIFHHDRVNEHTEKVRTIVTREIASWPLDRPVALHTRLRALTLRVILQTIFGDDDGRIDELHRRLLAMFMVTAGLTLHMPALRHTPPWRRLWRQFLTDRAGVDEILADLIIERAHRDGHDGGLLPMLVAPRRVEHNANTTGNVRDTIMSLILAGHETTGSELAWAVQLLAHHLEVRRRLVEDLDRDNDDYLNAVINEALRHRPVFLFTIPRAVAKAIDVGGRTYHPPVHLIGCVHLLQHDPTTYAEPEAFQPERFLDAAPQAEAWMPWGGGRKRCPGRHLAMLEMRTVLRTLFEQLEVEPARAQMETARWRTVIVTPGAGCRVVLRARRTNALSASFATHHS